MSDSLKNVNLPKHQFGKKSEIVTLHDPSKGRVNEGLANIVNLNKYEIIFHQFR